MSRPSKPAPAAVVAVVARSRAHDALLRPVRTGNSFEDTVERLLTTIKLGIVAPGERLPSEREFADRLGVSRLTLRDAIRELQRAGYVESRRGRYGGTFVSTVLPKLSKRAARRLARDAGGDLDDALLVREVLEVGSAEQAASRSLGDGERRHLEARLKECRSAVDLAEYRRRDSRFHLAITEVTGSPSLTSLVADARMRSNVFLDAIPVLRRNVEHSEDQHAAIVAAIVAGDACQARMLMSEHLAATAALLRGFLS